MSEGELTFLKISKLIKPHIEETLIVLIKFINFHAISMIDQIPVPIFFIRLIFFIKLLNKLHKADFIVGNRVQQRPDRE